VYLEGQDNLGEWFSVFLSMILMTCPRSRCLHNTWRESSDEHNTKHSRPYLRDTRQHNRQLRLARTNEHKTRKKRKRSLETYEWSPVTSLSIKTSISETMSRDTREASTYLFWSRTREAKTKKPKENQLSRIFVTASDRPWLQYQWSARYWA
jgi:hypothetical protein